MHGDAAACIAAAAAAALAFSKNNHASLGLTPAPCPLDPCAQKNPCLDDAGAVRACSGHGYCNFMTGACECDTELGWGGANCEIGPLPAPI